MAKYRLQLLGALARQMAFTPRQTLTTQLAAAETLLTEIDPAKAYPFDFVLFRITRYRPKKTSNDLLTGLALQHDLGLLIEQLSDTLRQASASLSEPVLLIDDLTARLGVTSKTIQRWRRRGLPARRFIFPDGKRRVGFVLSSVERFLAGQRDPLEQSNTTPIDAAERRMILRHARRLVAECRCGTDETTRRIARRLDRSPLTILHTLRKHDLENPGAAILTAARPAIDGARASAVIAERRKGQSILSLARQMDVSRGEIYRLVIAGRASKLSRRKMKFIDDPLYHQKNAESVIEAIAKSDDATIPASEPRLPSDLPSPLASLCRTPLLSPARERALFLKLNYHKMRFVKARRRLDPELATHRDLNRLERHLHRASQTRNEIVRANLRLVVSIARRHLSRRAGVGLMELVSEGAVILMRAVDSFDFHRGNKFSTYATLALMKGFARWVPQMLSSRTAAGSDELLQQAPDAGSTAADRLLDREQVDHLLRNLDARERAVLREHFGLGDRIPASYDELADRLGLTRQRIRQIEQAALAKLRAGAGQMPAACQSGWQENSDR